MVWNVNCWQYCRELGSANVLGFLFWLEPSILFESTGITLACAESSSWPHPHARLVALCIDNAVDGVVTDSTTMCFGVEMAFADFPTMQIKKGTPGSISMILQATIKRSHCKILGCVDTSRKPSLWHLKLIAACMNGDILIWRDTEQRWNSSSSSWWSPSLDFVEHVDSTIRKGVFENSEITVGKDDKIGTGWEYDRATWCSLWSAL